MSKVDLVALYFRRELSEAEDEVLARQLTQVPELADRFAELAAQDYAKAGLPEPRWPSRRKRRGLWVWLLAAACAGAWALYSLAPRSVEQVSKAPAAEASAGPVEKAVVTTGPAKPASTAVARPRLKVTAGAAGFSASLSVPRVAILRVLDAQGRVQRELNSDEPGHWSWDGLDSQAKLVPGGRYLFLVVSDGEEFRQWVSVGRRR
jgi:hypothetical protein